MNIILCILIFVKYSLKWRSTQTSDINVSLALCQILRVVSIWLKYHCNFQANMRGFIFHVISLHPLSISSIPRQKICKNIKMYTDIGIYTCKFIEKWEERNVSFIWCSIPTKLMMLKQCFRGIQEYMYCKNVWSISMKFLPWGKGAQLPCHITSPSIYYKCEYHIVHPDLCEILFKIKKYSNSGFSGGFKGMWCLLWIRSIWPTSYLWGHSVSMTHPMKPACIRYIPGPLENQILPYVDQDDLCEALEVEWGNSDLIRNFSLIQWDLEVQPTSNYFLEMCLQEYIRIRSCWPA